MSDEFEIWTGEGTDHAFGVQLGRVRYRVHSRSKCAGRSCSIHNPSDHHMSGWPLNYRADKGTMERTCPHGVGHTDPDDIAYHKDNGRGALSFHGCDGCCHPESIPANPPLHYEGPVE